jgi:hypothetical protein
LACIRVHPYWLVYVSRCPIQIILWHYTYLMYLYLTIKCNMEWLHFVFWINKKKWTRSAPDSLIRFLFNMFRSSCRNFAWICYIISRYYKRYTQLSIPKTIHEKTDLKSNRVVIVRYYVNPIHGGSTPLWGKK